MKPLIIVLSILTLTLVVNCGIESTSSKVQSIPKNKSASKPTIKIDEDTLNSISREEPEPKFPTPLNTLEQHGGKEIIEARCWSVRVCKPVRKCERICNYAAAGLGGAACAGVSGGAGAVGCGIAGGVVGERICKNVCRNVKTCSNKTKCNNVEPGDRGRHGNRGLEG